MKTVSLMLLLLPVFFLSCTGNSDHVIITYHLDRSDYIEKLTVTGTTQAVISFPVMPPAGFFGQTTITRLAEDGQPVKQGDTICVLSNPQLLSIYEEVRNLVDSLEAGLKKSEADNKLNVALLEAQLATSEAQLQISSIDTLRMKFAPEVQRKLAELETRKAMIEKEKTEKKLAATKAIGSTDIRQINARIKQERTRETSLAEQVRSLVLTAPHDGIVMRVKAPKLMFIGPAGIGTAGGPIREGSVLFFDNPVLQFPDLNKMQVSAEVAEADFKRINAGQNVFITIAGAGKQNFTGKVNRKNLVGHSDEMNSESKVKFYEVVIGIDSCGASIMPGLSATCDIILEEEKNALYVPTMALFEKDSSRVVYVKNKDKFLPVAVKTGFSGSSFTVIADGLKGDEIIALSIPPISLIQKESRIKEKSDTVCSGNNIENLIR
jgi:HlyD family secretion protein